MLDLALAHLVGDDDEHVAALAGDEGEAEAGVAGGSLDDGGLRVGARVESPVALGGLDHAQADAVLDRAGGVHHLELAEQAAGAGIEVVGSSIGVLPIISRADR